MFKKVYQKRARIKTRVRKKISGTTERPRMSIYRSLKQIHAQIIDDTKNETLVSASSLSNEIAEEVQKISRKAEKSTLVGELLAKKALEKGIKQVVFDRSGYEYHGRVRALAEGARKGGLKF